MYEYQAQITSVYDGDGVFEATIHLGLGLSIQRDIRLHGIDTPELKGNQKEAGIIVRDFVRSLILDKEVVVKTHYDKSGKYGRLLADINVNGVDLATLLINKGFGKVYFGGKKEEWLEDELINIATSSLVNR